MLLNIFHILIWWKVCWSYPLQVKFFIYKKTKKKTLIFSWKQSLLCDHVCFCWCWCFPEASGSEGFLPLNQPHVEDHDSHLLLISLF